MHFYLYIADWIVLSFLIHPCVSEYACVCTYSVERKVFSQPDVTTTVQGYLYEFDCKKAETVPGLDTKQFYAIALHHKLGYVTVDNELQYQTCPGDPSPADLIRPTTISTSTSTPTTTSATVEHTTQSSTTSSTISTKITTTLFTTYPVSTTTQNQQSSTVKPSKFSTTATTLKTTITSMTTSQTTATSTTPATTTKPSTLKSTSISRTTPKTVTSTMPTTTSTLKPFDTTGSLIAYVGIGFNMLNGNPMDIGGSDTGLLKTQRIFALTLDEYTQTAREAELNISKVCSTTRNYFLLHDGLSYQNELHTLVKTVDDKKGFTSQAFILNKEFNQLRQSMESGTPRNIYQDVETSCSLGNVRYKNDGNQHVKGFTISSEFAQDVCRLPKMYDMSTYLEFLDKWGTSIVMSAVIGTRSTVRYRMNGNQLLLRLQDTERNNLFKLLIPSGQYEHYGSSVIVNATLLANRSLADVGIELLTYQMGTQQAPVPIRLQVVPITRALNVTYWTQVVEGTLYRDVCYGNLTETVLRTIASNIEKALVDYTTTHTSTTTPLNASPIQVPMTWPYGTYGLYQAAPGCPLGKVSWETGFRVYDTEDSSSNNYYSSDIRSYLAGSFAKNNLETRFCMKTLPSVDNNYSRAWPNGTYCILRRNGCPSGFTSGYIYWDDQDLGNHNKAGGALPDGSYGQNTRIYYCCRDDAPVSTPLLMPRERPFILLRLGPTCQSIFGMISHEVVVRWDDEDTFNSDDVGGKHPLDDGGSKDHKLHFCHYRDRVNGMQPGIIG